MTIDVFGLGHRRLTWTVPCRTCAEVEVEEIILADLNVLVNVTSRPQHRGRISF